ncbi:hypothetical protein DFQ27_004407 [Actinomortierella ambigua]|uniref:poly(ADP-ribose) glycohydrolase n=1 Tax=Actinomortierella ambigua TaxID=1343610 RepID=A0A9P6U467_9FUNG|nr:hypothetical protein DFQ27_004407 [Actinomortierella ambigua]
MKSTIYFDSGPHHVLCKIDGVNDSTYPTVTQSAWDDKHVKLPCAPRKYPTEPDYWPDIVQGLSAPILTIRDLTDTMLQWNKHRGGPEWNFYTLEAFLNKGKPLSESGLGFAAAAEGDVDRSEGQSNSSPELVKEEEALLSDREARERSALADSDSENNNGSDHATDGAQNKRQTAEQIPLSVMGDDEGHMYLSSKETIRFFDVVLPRMQQLALRMPELIKVPIPLLMQQQDSAITLSQEQIACLLSHAFFNTFPGRWVPIRHKRRKPFNRRKARAAQQKIDVDEKGGGEASTMEHGGKGAKHHQQQQQQGKKPGHLHQRTLFDYFGKPGPATAAVTFGGQERVSTSTGSSGTAFGDGGALKRRVASDDEGAEGLEELMDIEPENESPSTMKEGQEGPAWTKLPPRKLPSINFISLFHAEDRKSASSNVMFAKLRCLIHYFDRVTSDMPSGTVTYHRQVLQERVDLKTARRIRSEPFGFSKVVVDLDGPLEDSPVGTLQLDFANKNLGGGALERGAVQEEIRFMICPELILTRLFTEQLQLNEALLIKGCERFSNYNGYSRTFEWHSDHRDPTPRDALGRRKTEICAIDATPFKSRVSKLEQFSEYHIWRELNKALVGFRVSPILADEWGMTKGDANVYVGSQVNRPIATGNWGCGAFGGNVHLKFVLQLLAASVCGAYAPNDGRLGHDVMYYAYGLEKAAEDIDKFMKVVEANQLSVEPERIMQCIAQYPRKNSDGEITGLREKNLLEYLANALGYVNN